MSLQSLRDLRVRRLRPADIVSVFTRACPWPHRDWYLDDPTKVWLAGPDVRIHDLRPLTGLRVMAFVDDLAARHQQIVAGLTAVGAQLIGISDGNASEIGPGCTYPEASLPMARQWLIDLWSHEWN